MINAKHILYVIIRLFNYTIYDNLVIIFQKKMYRFEKTYL